VDYKSPIPRPRHTRGPLSRARWKGSDGPGELCQTGRLCRRGRGERVATRRGGRPIIPWATRACGSAAKTDAGAQRRAASSATFDTNEVDQVSRIAPRLRIQGMIKRETVTRPGAASRRSGGRLRSLNHHENWALAAGRSVAHGGAIAPDHSTWPSPRSAASIWRNRRTIGNSRRRTTKSGPGNRPTRRSAPRGRPVVLAKSFSMAKVRDRGPDPSSDRDPHFRHPLQTLDGNTIIYLHIRLTRRSSRSCRTPPTAPLRVSRARCNFRAEAVLTTPPPPVYRGRRRFRAAPRYKTCERSFVIDDVAASSTAFANTF